MVRWKTYNCYSFDHTAVPRDKNKTPKQIEENKENIPPPNHHCSHLMNRKKQQTARKIAEESICSLA
ncbi:hypothetical protein Bca52824_080925 [Brassica carinata]|uniref:Uncharacterized protein n=1 Tax=Brassica carinata TaxID=52824 RepID=A0A8X7PE87_BRACI|nr:hypothetical protein Bca52824_080925 [Brassica carinata]